MSCLSSHHCGEVIHGQLLYSLVNDNTATGVSLWLLGTTAAGKQKTAGLIKTNLATSTELEKLVPWVHERPYIECLLKAHMPFQFPKPTMRVMAESVQGNC